ncbi:hypothetical protein B0H14DRAFT_2612654 [Mycena olivaceomarginata]|nr:hypothetical protein B0H14DRAFT_2612654 [Mycena olivaceomarginata]
MAVQAMDGPAGLALDVIWQKDVHEPGKATCPKCGLLRSYRTAGVINLVKKHLDKEICKDTKRKQDKELRKNGSLKAFSKEKVALIATFLKHQEEYDVWFGVPLGGLRRIGTNSQRISVRRA